MSKTTKPLFIRTLWGLNINYAESKAAASVFNKIKKQGFSGVEIATAFLPKEHYSLVQSILNDLDLKVITQIHTTGYPVVETDPSKHYDDFRSKVEQALLWNPLLINSHTGRDDWMLETSVEFFRKVSEFEGTLGATTNISHETHRQRTLCTHTICSHIIQLIPKLNFTLDLSHWVISAERLLSNSTDPEFENMLKILASRLKYLHARVGSPNQIQVIDPQSEDNRENREYFYSIWKQLIESNPDLPVNIEYGPAPYAIGKPNSGVSLKNVEKLIAKEIKILGDTL
jgi:sugar phosphate isomerase/epimerase